LRAASLPPPGFERKLVNTNQGVSSEPLGVDMRDSIIGDGQLFQPDVLLPSQYFAAMRRRVPKEPEYRLIVAVLEDAIDCYQKHLFAREPKARQLFEDAAEWIGSDDRSWPYSFVSICDILNLNPHYVRGGLEGWRAAQLSARTNGRVVRLPYARQARPRDQEPLPAEVG
jgi:hypothetical protein